MNMAGKERATALGLFGLFLLAAVPAAWAQRLFPNPVYATGNSPESVAIGDLNRDGHPDLAVANVLGDDVSVLLNQSSMSGNSGDMNCDGRLDGGDIDPFFACLGGGGCP